MKKLLLTALTVSMLALVGCSSNDNDNDNPTPTNKIKLVSGITGEPGNPNTTNFTYDDQNRLIKVDTKEPDWLGENYDYTYTITYTGNTIRLIEIDKEGIDTTYAETNNNGYISSMKEDGVTTNLYYTYDANGYLTKLEETYVGTYNITWANGNIVKIQGDANADDQTIYEYEYTNIENKMNLNMFEMSCGFEWLEAEVLPLFPYGKQCKNLISKVKENGNVTNEYQYTMTSDGYISKIIGKRNDGGLIETLEANYSYIEVDAK